MVSTTIQTTLPNSQQQPTARPASPLLASPFRRKTMSITQTYYLAHKARAKLSSEAQRPDHNLRKLVGSANLLDALMMELADAEREQESWFNQSVRASTTPKNAERRVQWADSVVEEPEDDWEADDAASDSSDEESEFDDDEEDVEMADIVSLTRVSSAVNKAAAASMATQDNEYFDDDEEDYEHLSLTRSPSHSASPPPPPDLDEDDSDISEDESMPPSPETATLPAFNEKEEAKQQQETQSPPTSPTGQGFYSEGYYIPPRNPAGLISAISVY
ncbi:uncharacterized protein PpBr36_06077 [Pyricularia pennisetigena]|uniref:uncharacterized protein n=1 Tax=Pyricularia pennisetigena TaxID=1578925 RepID=UPI00114E48BC|nr:uncharacterized protein PpBr36_06077 [Pyricularia pennisetigena]TLS23046.1 hypothetical protein PpBr36_06077 [Pyricularia pennisetigena]